MSASAIAFCLACLVLASFCQMASGAGDIGLARMKGNLLGYWTGAEANKDDPLVAASLRGIQQEASAALIAMRAEGSWGDIDYDGSSGWEIRLADHLSRVESMALGYRTPGQSSCGDPDLLTAVEKSLSFIHRFVAEGCATPGNWWWWQIAMPRTLGKTLLLMEGSLSPATVEEVKKTIRYLLIDDLPHSTGQNMIWLAMDHLYLALLDGDREKAAALQTAFADQCTVHAHEGIKEDYSFHQHGPLLYTGGYGRNFAEDVAEYIWIARDTQYRIPEANLETFARYIMDGRLWCIYRNYHDPSCIGREITRGNMEPMEVPLSLLVLANMPNSRREDAISAAKSLRQANPAYGMWTEPLWSAIKGAPTAASALVGHRHFWESDYTVHRREGFFASLRMFSDRTRAAELVIGEGKTSWHQSDGLLWIFLRGSEYVTRDVLPTLDWLRLPGTTVERKRLEPGEGYEWQLPVAKRSFVGGAFTEDSGASAMELAASASDLTARKSWFFFDDEIVCLGSDINCLSNNPAETVINQWPLSDAAAPLTVDGQVKPPSLPWSEEMQRVEWAHCDGIGYYFPEPQFVKGKRAMQAGSWRDLSDMQDDTVHSNPFLTLWFDHGTRATAAAYAYAILPGKTAAVTQAYAAAKEITILAHDSSAHAVRQNRRDMTGIVFWNAGSVGGISVDRPCVVFCEEDDEGLTLAVSDPTHAASAFRITLDEQLVPERLPPEVVSTIVGGKTVVTYHAEKGRNYLARFRRWR